MIPLHESQPVMHAGVPMEDAASVMILLHGRGATAQDILSLATHLRLENCALQAPRARGQSWYPKRFIAPEAENQPFLDSALATVNGLIQRALDRGMPGRRIYLLGFSQGACLALEAAARTPRPYGGIFALSGALIGLGVNRRDFTGDLEQTPIVMGCSDHDPHIPKERFLESTGVLKALNADVDAVLYDDLGHAVNDDEIRRINRILAQGCGPADAVDAGG